MDWQIRLIAIYLFVNQSFEDDLQFCCQRMGNGTPPKFTDEEVIVTFLWGIMQNRTKIKDIYNYTNNHLREWFPDLPSYTAYITRLNRLENIFVPLIEKIQNHFPSYVLEKYPLN